MTDKPKSLSPSQQQQNKRTRVNAPIPICSLATCKQPIEANGLNCRRCGGAYHQRCAIPGQGDIAKYATTTTYGMIWCCKACVTRITGSKIFAEDEVENQRHIAILGERKRLADELKEQQKVKNEKIKDLESRLKCLREMPAHVMNLQTTVRNLNAEIEKQDREIEHYNQPEHRNKRRLLQTQQMTNSAILIFQ